MKTLFLLIGLAALAAPAACDRRPDPTADDPPAVTATVEFTIGDQVQRFDLRSQRVPGGFRSALRAMDQAGRGRAFGSELAAFPFVRDDVGPAGPLTIDTPAGPVTAALSYRPLGPWQVLDHATLNVPGARAISVAMALHDPRLER